MYSKLQYHNFFMPSLLANFFFWQLKSVLAKFSEALMANKLPIVDNLDTIVEFLETFEV